MSMTVWVKVGTLSGTVDIVSKHTDANQEWRFMLTNDRKPRAWFFDDSAGATAYEGEITDAGISADTWHHLVFTRDATQGENASDGFTWYVDGSAVASTEDSGAGTYVDMEDLTATLMIGHTTTGAATSFFVGEMALLGLTRKELTAHNVDMLYRQGQRLLRLP